MRAWTTCLAAWRAAASFLVKFENFRYVARDWRVERHLGSMDGIFAAGRRKVGRGEKPVL